MIRQAGEVAARQPIMQGILPARLPPPDLRDIIAA